jgi:methyl acetate hydrolase
MRCWLMMGALFLTACGPGSVPEFVFSESTEERIRDFLRETVETGSIPAIEAVVVNANQVLLHEVFGMRNVSGNAELEKGDLFNVASMAKPVTAIAAMILVEEGQISLDDPIEMYLAEVAGLDVMVSFDMTDTTYVSAPPTTPITVRHLLNHTSGMAYPWWDERLGLIAMKTGDARTLYYDHWALPLLHEPGNEWSYGVSARVLGELVEEASGESLSEFFAERITRPLGMDRTFYEIPPDLLDRRVTVHVKEEDGTWTERSVPDRHEPLVIGDAALLSTGSDYARLLRMLMNGGELDGVRILTEASVAAMTRNQIGDLVVRELFNDFPDGAGRDKFGFGFQIASSMSEVDPWPVEGTYSWAGSNNSFFWVDPANGVGAVVLMHYVPFFDDNAQEILREIGRMVYDGAS